MGRYVVAIAILISVSLACAGESSVVRMGTEGAYPPFNFINENGEVAGFERELTDELCRRADLQCSWVIDEWDGLIDNLAAGEFDTIISGMSITAARDQIIDFTHPYLPPSASVYVSLPGADDQVVTARVAAQVATVQADYLSQSGATLVEYPLASDAVEAVLSGEVDAALFDVAFAQGSIAEHEGRLSVVGPRVTLDSGVGIGVREDDSDLKERLDRAIESMKEDGWLNTLITEWFGPDAELF